MDSSRWEKIQAIFLEAVDRPAADRAKYVAAACGGDAELTAEVHAMLEADGTSATVLDRGLPDVAYQMLGLPVLSLPCQEVGPYRLKEILGQGGMGIVCLAEREDTGATVAIKFLLHAGMSAPRREGFAREIKTLAQLRHPYIARLYDAGSLPDGTPWFVMEYVQGVRLTDYCVQKNLPVEARVRLFRAACEAVQYAYRLGIIHRDLKPSNILVENDGTPRLLDFGIARQMQNPDAGEQTHSGVRYGSVGYSAPEWLRDGIVASYTDVYSLGVILYEMLAGRRPKTDGDAPPEKPSQAVASAGAGKGAWSDLDALCLKAMHRDPRQRYQSVEELLRDIDHYLKWEPLEARAGSLGHRAAKFVRRNRRAVVAGTLAATMIAGLVAFYTVRLTKAKTKAVAEAARAQRVEKFLESLFEGGDEEAGPSADMKVVTILDSGVRKLASLDRDPAVQAHLYQTLGTVYQAMGMFDRADALLQTALHRIKSVYGPDHEEVADTMLRIVLLRIDQSRFAEAERLAEETIAMDRRHLRPDDLATAEAEAALGTVLLKRGEYERTIQLLTDALPHMEAAGAPDTHILAYRGMLANAHFGLGHYAMADRLNRQVLALDQRMHGARHPDVEDDYVNLGHLQYQWGHFPEAERYYRQALDIFQSYYGKDYPNAADIMSYVAKALIMEGRYDEASNFAEPAVRILERAFPSQPHAYLAMAIWQLGSIAQHRGHLQQAETYLQRVYAMYQSVYGDQHPTTAIALSYLGVVYADEGHYERAESLLRDALQRLTRALPAGHLNIGTAHLRLGHLLIREKRFQDAETESLAGYRIVAKADRPARELAAIRAGRPGRYL